MKNTSLKSAATISFTKNKVKWTYCKEMEIRRKLDPLDDIICSNFYFSEIDLVSKQFDDLKKITSINIRQERISSNFKIKV